MLERKRSRSQEADGGESDDNDVVTRPSSLSKDHTVLDIDVDLPRTFPILSFFHDGGEWENRLRGERGFGESEGECGGVCNI